ncbi:hypothetical protein BT63DRAFT_483986 [Microthyrium microscopicum]|uniref:SWIM-type domain-containing protein n=1 Tax=Microthyrium microscopicum TaxID=703497 RepID=A0A6A6TUS1_9PEZI|nr:hypothetical protein BT63DRAFT_483986 [Microthyrium microscopicum]
MANVEVIDLTGDSPPPKQATKIQQTQALTQYPLQQPYSSYPYSQAYTMAVQEKPQSSRSKKRKAPAKDHEDAQPKAQSKSSKKRKAATDGEEGDNEKRLRRFRQKETSAYLQLKERALTQKMFVLSRTRHSNDDHPHEDIKIAGTTGNVYTIQIDEQPTCDCPYGLKNPQCKHIIYALINVLKAPRELQYQLAFIASELREIFNNAPPIVNHEDVEKAEEGEDPKRKPIDGEDCPICFTPMDAKAKGKDKPVFCKAACGNNFHAECFDGWAATKRSARAKVTCPLCRSLWEEAAGPAQNIGSVLQGLDSAQVNEDGYVNVARQVGMTGQRDYSTYHQHWVNRHVRGSGDRGDYFGF